MLKPVSCPRSCDSPQADVEEDRAAFASMPFVEGVSEVLAALSKDWLTEEEIAAPIEEPEEWTPEVGANV